MQAEGVWDFHSEKWKQACDGKKREEQIFTYKPTYRIRAHQRITTTTNSSTIKAIESKDLHIYPKYTRPNKAVNMPREEHVVNTWTWRLK